MRFLCYSEIIAELTQQLKAQYSYDRSWLVNRMAQMAKGQASQVCTYNY
jgi:hypothetical protein